MIDKLKAEMESTEYMCTTADIWSTKNKYYLGMTAHWTGDEWTRKSVALGCRRFVGSHTYDKIAELSLLVNYMDSLISTSAKLCAQ